MALLQKKGRKGEIRKEPSSAPWLECLGSERAQPRLLPQKPSATRAASYTPNVLKKLLKQVRRLQFVADWLDLRAAKLEDRKLHARYEADVKARPEDEREHVWSEYSDESHIIWDPIYVRQTNKLVARARKYGIRVPPLPTESTGDDNWEWSFAATDWILSDSAQELLKLKIRVEERENEDEFRKRATLFVSIGAFILALLSLIVSFKHRPPDPCPKNYYRNDQGECVFALQKKSTSQPQQSTPPTPLVQPKKPSAASPKPF